MADGTPRCLVLGGSGTVGQAVCAALDAEGASVAFTYNRNEESARQLAEVLSRGNAFRLDLTDNSAIKTAIDSVVEELGGLDALVHCAAVTGTEDLEMLESFPPMSAVGESRWNRVMAVNVRSAYFAISHASEVAWTDTCRVPAELAAALGRGELPPGTRGASEGFRVVDADECPEPGPGLDPGGNALALERIPECR